MELDHRNGSSKHSEPEKDTADGVGTCSPSDAYLKLPVRIGNSNHFGVNAEMIDGSPSSTSSEPHHATVFDEIGSRNNLTPNLDNGVNEDVVMISSMHIDSPSSSASSNSSLEDLFQVEANKGSAPVAPFIPSDEPQRADSPPSFRPQGNGAYSRNQFKSEVVQEGFPASAFLSTECEVLHEPTIPIMSPPTQSPPMQMMETPEAHDPFRIPSAVFESCRSTTPLDWSVASNESLFSIHVGNNSFSRDSAFPISGEIEKSGELLMYSPKPQFGTPVDDSPLVPIMQMENKREPFQPEKSTAAIEAPEFVVENRKIKKATKAAAVEAQNEQKKPVVVTSREPSGLSTHSNGSGDSGKSFAFPILSDRATSGSDNATPVKEKQHANDEEVNLQPSPDAPIAQNSGYCGWFMCFSSCCSWGFPYRLRRCCC